MVKVTTPNILYAACRGFDSRVRLGFRLSINAGPEFECLCAYDFNVFQTPDTTINMLMAGIIIGKKSFQIHYYFYAKVFTPI